MLDNILQLSIGQLVGVMGTVIRLGDVNLKIFAKYPPNIGYKEIILNLMI